MTAVGSPHDRVAWTGPHESDLRLDGLALRHPVPPERWPFGPPDHHQDGCGLHAGRLYCDCLASAADDDDHGEASWPTRMGVP